MCRKLILIILLLNICFYVSAQNFYRISGEFSIKAKNDSIAHLVMGKFYYDKNERAVIHENYFPVKETWITSDTNLYRIIEGAIVSRQFIPDLTDFSIYNMILNNRLENFGLNEDVFTLEHVERSDDMVISTWIPPKKMEGSTGKILISTRNKNMFGIIFFNDDEEIIKKQFFEDYIMIGGLAFPGKIIEITYVDGKESYMVSTYKNIKVNDLLEEDKYHFNPDNF